MPNNWASIFAGSVWEYDEKSEEFYFHMFSKEQPDLNWENKEMVKDYLEIIKFWNDKGISGYKIDALSHISKDQKFPNYKSDEKLVFGDMHCNGPKMDEYIGYLSHAIKDNNDNVILAEMANVTP